MALHNFLNSVTLIIAEEKNVNYELFTATQTSHTKIDK